MQVKVSKSKPRIGTKIKKFCIPYRGKEKGMKITKTQASTSQEKEMTQKEAELQCAYNVLDQYGIGGGQADFSNRLLDGIDLSHKDLTNAVFDGAELEKVNLQGSKVDFVTFYDVKFSNCNCQGLNGENTEFGSAVFEGCNFNDAVLTHSNLSHTKFRNCSFDGAVLKDCCLEGTDFDGIKIYAEGCSENEVEWLGENTENRMI
jgi:hypothetical protein